MQTSDRARLRALSPRQRIAWRPLACSHPLRGARLLHQSGGVMNKVRGRECSGDKQPHADYGLSVVAQTSV